MTYQPTPEEIEREAERLYNNEISHVPAFHPETGKEKTAYKNQLEIVKARYSNFASFSLTQRYEAMEKVKEKCAEEAENYDDFVSWTKVSDPESYVQDRNNKIAQAIRSIDLKEIE